MKNIENADNPKSSIPILPVRPSRVQKRPAHPLKLLQRDTSRLTPALNHCSLLLETANFREIGQF